MTIHPLIDKRVQLWYNDLRTSQDGSLPYRIGILTHVGGGYVTLDDVFSVPNSKVLKIRVLDGNK